MNRPSDPSRSGSLGLARAKDRAARVVAFGLACLAFAMTGCEVDSFFDPSKTGYFERVPTTIPVLTRLDIIEPPEELYAEITSPTAEDLVPNQLEYRLAPGDVVQTEIFELVEVGVMDISVRVVDQSGEIRLPTLGNVPAAGLTLEGLQAEIETRLLGRITDPLVTITLQAGRSFQFTIYGAVRETGIYALERPDFRLVNALALAGGADLTTQKVYVIREVALDASVEPRFGRDGGGDAGTGAGGAGATDPGVSPVDIEELINQLEGGTSPGGLQDDDPPPLDLDDLTGAGAADRPVVDGDVRRAPGAEDARPSEFVFDETLQEWVRVAPSEPVVPGSGVPARRARLDPVPATPTSYATRVIEVDYQQLAAGNSDLNVVIRPNDRIFVDPPTLGFVYIGGEITRPGVFNLPSVGQLTLSRFVDVAGGLGPIAIPERVDLVRKVGDNREAVIRVNLGAIRNRGEPDIVMKPDDHVIIGTNFWATPLAVMRNGFRMTYGFGFLLDRNFGNDVFGPPPVNVVGG